MKSKQDASGAAGMTEPVVGTFDQIYRAHFDFVWRNARRLGVPECSTEDVVQDIFMIVALRFADFEGRAPIRAWIFGILSRVSSEYRRSLEREGARPISLAQAPTPSDLAERSERALRLERLLSQLDDRKRTVFVLSKLEQWTLREIAESLGSDRKTIQSQLLAAKRAFAKVCAGWRAKREAHREKH